jgi:hypothetical protein
MKARTRGTRCRTGDLHDRNELAGLSDWRTDYIGSLPPSDPI